MSKKRMLFISAYYPNPAALNKATYIKQILAALQKYYQIDGVVPVPWYNRSKIPMEAENKGINICYPSYFYTPLIFRSLYGSFYYYSIIKQIKKLINANRYDFVYSVWLYPDAWVAAKIAKMLDIPLYVKAIGTDVNRLRVGSLLASRLLELAETAKKIIAVSNPLKDKMIQMGCESGKVLYLQNGVDHDIFFPADKAQVRNELGIDPDEKIILYVGNLKKEKGLAELADAFADIVRTRIYPKVKLLVIGDGRYKPELINRLTSLDVYKYSTIFGEKPLHEIARFMNSSDVVCLPSYMEGQPNVVIEALTCHAKVVATNVGGIPDLDDGQGNIELVPSHSVVELRDALIRMIDKDDNDKSSRCVYSWEEYALRLSEIFEDCCH